jgi:hypothetical protein
VAEEHGHAVQGIVLGGYYIRLTDACPVEAGVQDGLPAVAVEEVVGPSALAILTLVAGS